MSALRDLVGAGGGACAAPDERAGSSNPMARFADAVGDRKGKPGDGGAPRRRRPGGAFADQFLSQQRLRENLLGGGGLRRPPGSPPSRATPPRASPRASPRAPPTSPSSCGSERRTKTKTPPRRDRDPPPSRGSRSPREPPPSSPRTRRFARRCARRWRTRAGWDPRRSLAHPPLPRCLRRRDGDSDRSAIMARHQAEAGGGDSLGSPRRSPTSAWARAGGRDGRPRTHAGRGGVPVVVPTGRRRRRTRGQVGAQFAAAAGRPTHAAAAAAPPRRRRRRVSGSRPPPAPERGRDAVGGGSAA